MEKHGKYRKYRRHNKRDKHHRLEEEKERENISKVQLLSCAIKAALFALLPLLLCAALGRLCREKFDVVIHLDERNVGGIRGVVCNKRRAFNLQAIWIVQLPLFVLENAIHPIFGDAGSNLGDEIPLLLLVDAGERLQLPLAFLCRVLWCYGSACEQRIQREQLTQLLNPQTSGSWYVVQSRK